MTLDEDLTDLVAQIEYRNSPDLTIEEPVRVERKIRNGTDVQIVFNQGLDIQRQEHLKLNGKIKWEILFGNSMRQIQVTPFLLNLEADK